jgi:hypothetical protein
LTRRLRTAAATLAAAVTLAAPAARAAEAPAVLDAWATDVSASAVDLRGLANPGGAAATARFEYLTVAAYEANLAADPPRDPFAGAARAPLAGIALGSGEAPVAVSRHIGALSPSTSYRYRLNVTAATTTFGAAHSFTTTENAPVFALPDNRGWEMVSPVEKNGGEIQGPGEIFGGGVFQASADGTAMTFSSRSSFASPAAASSASQYVSRRGAGGWATENVTTPALAGAFGTEPDGVPYRLFSPDLARGLLAAPERCDSSPCPRGYALRQSVGGALAASAKASDMSLAGTNPELTQAVLASGGNLYRWSGGAQTAVNLLPGEATPTPGAELAAQSGAVSSDGSRVYFTLAGDLYLRDGAQTLQVDESLGGGAVFETATADGSLAFFTKAGHLYRYAAGGAPADLTPGGEVEGVLGISPDGSHLYYLTPAGLFLRRGASTTKVADAADAGDYPPATGTARVAANGNLAFLSSQSLTGADSGGLAQVYLYAPGTATLTCASCNPSGARPTSPATIPGAVANGSTRIYKPRALSADGRRLFFETGEALFTLDTNNDRDVYEWEAQGTGSCAAPGGCIALVSSGQAAAGASFLDASADGADVFFLTDGSLVPGDTGGGDVYDARAGGGFPVPVPPLACVADACQPIPGEPEDPTAGTSFYRAEGNPALRWPGGGSKAAAKRKAAKRQAARRRAAKRRAAAKRKAAAKKRAAKQRGGHR